MIAPADSEAERDARDVARRVRQSEPGDARLVSEPTIAGERVLSGPGRRYFEPFVGAELGRARVHVDAHAARLAQAAQARALTYGHDVFVPPARFAPETTEGRALLGHELTHVARGAPGTIFLDAARYPSATEQREIERLLGRRLERAAEVESPVAEGEAPRAVERGRAITVEEQKKLADSLMGPFYEPLGRFAPPAESVATVHDQAGAFDLATRAQRALQERFGTYLERRITLTQTDTSAAARIAADEVLVQFGAGPSAGADMATTLIDTDCGPCQSALGGLTDESKAGVRSKMVAIALAHRGPELLAAARARVSGSYSRGRRRLLISEYTPNPYGTAVHEMLHALAHPAFHAAFIDERNIIEGFTEYFTRQIVSERGSYEDAVTSVSDVRRAMSGPFVSDFEGGSAEESLRQAYFRGRLDLIGWRPSGQAEAAAVTAAGGAAEWDPATAQNENLAFQTRLRAAQAAQAPHRNVLGVGLFFATGGASAISVRYARVVSRSEPLARRQLFVEGQVVGGPIESPARLGGSFGLGLEYQEPYFYVAGGARLVGTGALSGPADVRLDVSPFVGVGVRAWQRVRIGAEGFVLLPVTGQSIEYGAGGTVSVEF